VSRTTAQLEAEALAMPCAAHDVPAGEQCPDGGACMDRYGLSPQQWVGWFGAGPSAQLPRRHEPECRGTTDTENRAGRSAGDPAEASRDRDDPDACGMDLRVEPGLIPIGAGGRRRQP